MYKKSTLFKANPKASPKVRENLYLIILPPQVSVQGFIYLYFTNISIKCNAIKVPVLSALLYIRFLAPFLSFMYHLIYIAPFSLSIAKDYRGVSSTSFKYLFQLATESCIYIIGASFMPNTLKLGPYSPLTVGRREPLKLGLYGPLTVERQAQG